MKRRDFLKYSGIGGVLLLSKITPFGFGGYRVDENIEGHSNALIMAIKNGMLMLKFVKTVVESFPKIV